MMRVAWMHAFAGMTLVVMLAGCTESASAPAAPATPLRAADHLMSIAPRCAEDDDEPKQYWYNGGTLGTSSEPINCTLRTRHALQLDAPLRITPYKDGSAKVDFACDAAAAAQFSRRFVNRRMLLVTGNKALGHLMVDSTGFSQGCFYGGITVEDALVTCLALSEELNKDPEACGSQCIEGKESWACIAAK
jgi:hypothetical protein